MKRITIQQLTPFAVSLLLLTGCTNPKIKPTPENFTHTINAWLLDHPDCLLSNIRFPYETSNKEETRQMDTLITVQLLTKAEEMSIHASRYTPTTTGARYVPNFCFGHREVTAIESFTPPTLVDGFPQTTVTYAYTMLDVPIWAKNAPVVAAFPKLAAATTGHPTATITIAQSSVGWTVPN